jgi:hypothetical protein
MAPAREDEREVVSWGCKTLYSQLLLAQAILFTCIGVAADSA